MTNCSRGGHWAWNIDPQNHDFQPHRLMRAGMLLKCEVCQMAAMVPRSSPSFPRKYTNVFSRHQYLSVYPGSPTQWVDPGPGEELASPIAEAAPQSAIYKELGFDPKLEPVVRAYYTAFEESCRNHGLVLGVEAHLFVCAPPELLPGFENSPVTAHRVRVIIDFDDFLTALRAEADQYATKHKADELPLKTAAYWAALTQQIHSLISESGAVERIKAIDRKFHLKGRDVDA